MDLAFRVARGVYAGGRRRRRRRSSFARLLRGILALAYNRHAAVEIRRRLEALIGDDARGVTVLTCHAFAMRLAGASFAGRAEGIEDQAFSLVMKDAVALLEGRGLEPDAADEQRERLLAGFRWILVDEYQDVVPRSRSPVPVPRIDRLTDRRHAPVRDHVTDVTAIRASRSPREAERQEPKPASRHCSHAHDAELDRLASANTASPRDRPRR